MPMFQHIHGHLRLSVEALPGGGWIAAVYDLSVCRYLVRDGFVHDTAEEARTHAKQQAETLLGRVLGVIDWEYSRQ
jgi:hypothetical protein